MKASVDFFRQRRKLESRRLLSNYRKWLEAGTLQAGEGEPIGRVTIFQSSKLVSPFKHLVWAIWFLPSNRQA